MKIDMSTLPMSFSPAAGLFEAIGGRDGCFRLAGEFYRRVPHDPVLSRVYHMTREQAAPRGPSDKPGCVVTGLALYLAQVLGGPNDYTRNRFWLSLTDAHERFVIGPAERDAWLRVMGDAIDAVGIVEPARAALREFFAESSAHVVNRRGEGNASGEPRAHVNVPGWTVQRALDEIAAAVREGDSSRAIALADAPEMQDYFSANRTVHAAVLGLMGGHGDAALLDFIRRRLAAEPGLVRESYRGGRTLLHDAAGTGCAAFVEMVLGLGGDVNAGSDYGHTPLHCAANEAGTADVVRALVRAGTDVNAAGNVKRATPLHNAARRGNVGVAEALVDCGANLEARDSNGETPLRRAVNCAKVDVAALLAARGADVQSVGSKGLTVAQAARMEAMRAALCV